MITTPPRTLAAACALSVAISAGAQTPPAAAVARQATVTVDFAASRGPMLRTERINNLTGPDAPWTPQLAADVPFMNQNGLHGSLYRVWINDNPIDVAASTHDLANVAGYLDQASKLSDSLLLVMNPRKLMAAGKTPVEIKSVMKPMIRELKQRWPQIRYIEAFNEPDHNFAKLIKPEQLYAYYVPFYEIVNEVNRELNPKVPLEVGGPAFMMYNEEWMRPFLDSYKADPAPGKKLDFISYHEYGEFPPGTGDAGGPRAYDFYKSNPSRLTAHRVKLEEELKSRGLDTRIPSFITETGLYPGPSFDDKDNPHADYIRQAAGMPSYMYWFLESPHVVPFNWVLRHRTEERKDQLLTRAGEGKPVPTGIFTPYGNALAMMAKLKDERVTARSSALAEGKGVYAIASKDQSGAAVMVWNYQHVGTQPYRVTIDMGQLPANLRGKSLRQRMFRIDDTVSNYWGSPATANLQQVSETTVKPSQRHSVSVDLTPNSLQLVVLEPAGPAVKRR